jgi:hypothetical protein
MTSSRSLPILLALTLLLAQQAGQAHALSHLGPDSLKEGISHTTLCAKCSTFGQLSSFVPATASITFDSPISVALLTVVDSGSIRRTTTAFQSRAPPSLA